MRKFLFISLFCFFASAGVANAQAHADVVSFLSQGNGLALDNGSSSINGDNLIGQLYGGSTSQRWKTETFSGINPRRFQSMYSFYWMETQSHNNGNNFTISQINHSADDWNKWDVVFVKTVSGFNLFRIVNHGCDTFFCTNLCLNMVTQTPTYGAVTQVTCPFPLSSTPNAMLWRIYNFTTASWL